MFSNLVGTLIDIGNIIFFVGNLPQLITAYRNRTNLQGLSSKMLFLFMISTVFFILAGALTDGMMTIILGLVNEIIFSIQLFWKHKYRHKKSDNVVPKEWMQ